MLVLTQHALLLLWRLGTNATYLPLLFTLMLAMLSQDYIVGRAAWQAALNQLPITDKGDAYTLMACKLAGRCPHTKLREQYLLQLLDSKSGLTALAGLELISQGRQTARHLLSKTLVHMTRMPGNRLWSCGEKR